MGRTLSSLSTVHVHDRPVGGLGAKLIRGGVEVGTYSGNYAMQAANDAAQNGDRILVNPGRYTQGMLDQLYLYKNISLEANGGLVQIEKQIVLNGPGLPASGMNPVIAISWQAHGQGYPTLRGNVAIKGFEIFQTQNIPDRTWYPGAADGRLILVIHAFDMNIVGSAGDLLLERLYLHDASCGVGWTNGLEKPSALRSSTIAVKSNIWRRLGNFTSPTNHHLYGGDSLGLFEGNLFEATNYPEAKVPPTIVPGTPEYTGDDPGYPPYPDGHVLKWQCDEAVIRGNAFVFDTYGTNSPMIDCAYGCKVTIEDNWLHMGTYALAQDSLIRYGRLVSAQDSPEGGSYAEHWKKGNNWTIERNTLVNASQNFFRDTNRHIEISLCGYGFGHNPPNGNGHIPNPAGYDAYLNSKHPNGWANPSTIQHNVFAGPGNPPTTDPGGIGIWGSPYPTNKAVPLADLVDPAVRFSGWELKDYTGAKLPAPVARKQYVHGDDPAAGIWPSCIDVTSDHYGAVAGTADQTPAWFKAIAPNTWGRITRADGYSLAMHPNSANGWGGWMDAYSGIPAPDAAHQVISNDSYGTLFHIDTSVCLGNMTIYNPQINQLVTGLFAFLPPTGGHGGRPDNSSYAIGPIDSDVCRIVGVTKSTNPEWKTSQLTDTGRGTASHNYMTAVCYPSSNSAMWGNLNDTMGNPGAHQVQPGVEFPDGGNLVGMKFGYNTWVDTSNDALAFSPTGWQGGSPANYVKGIVNLPAGIAEKCLVYDEPRNEVWAFGRAGASAQSLSNASSRGGLVKGWECFGANVTNDWAPINFIDGRFVLMCYSAKPWEWWILDRDYLGPNYSSAPASERQKLPVYYVTPSGLPPLSGFGPQTWATTKSFPQQITRTGNTATLMRGNQSPLQFQGYPVGSTLHIGVWGCDQPQYNGTFDATVTVAEGPAVLGEMTYPITGSPASPATGNIFWTYSVGAIGACTAYDPVDRRIYIYFHTYDGATVEKDLWVIQLPATLVTYDASWNATVTPWPAATRLVVTGGHQPEWCHTSVGNLGYGESSRVTNGEKRNFSFVRTGNGLKGIWFNHHPAWPPIFFRLP